MPAFVPGLTLSRLFYEQGVRPVLDRHWPELTHSAALLGPGSEVLGLDTPQSTDHHWGPRLILFLREPDLLALSGPIDEALRQELPHEVGGVPTNFGEPDAVGVRLLVPTQSGPVQHMVNLQTIERFWQQELAFSPSHPPTLREWLAVPQQRLLSMLRGAVFHDGLGDLAAARDRIRWYPHDLWLYLMAAQWSRVAQEEAFVGRCGDVGDELGSRLVAGRVVHDLMRLCFLMERVHAPYAKWFGTAFGQLHCSPALSTRFELVLAAPSWKEREHHLAVAFSAVAALHNALGVTPPLPTAVSPFHDRPYLVIHGHRFADALHGAITDPAVKALPRGVGSVDQFVDNADVLRHGAARLGRLVAEAHTGRPGLSP